MRAAFTIPRISRPGTRLGCPREVMEARAGRSRVRGEVEAARARWGAVLPARRGRAARSAVAGSAAQWEGFRGAAAREAARLPRAGRPPSAMRERPQAMAPAE